MIKETFLPYIGQYHSEEEAFKNEVKMVIQLLGVYKSCRSADPVAVE